MQYKESPVTSGIRVYPLKKPGFSMVYYSVNQAINDKKSVIKIKNSVFTKCDINCTYKSSRIHVHTSGTVCPIQAAIRTFQISPLKMNNKFQGFHPTCINLVWTSFNEMKKAYFQDQYRCLF